MKALILAGGMGTRLREETEFKPKPMVEIGGKPIIWHIIRNLSQNEIKDVVVCLGYKGEILRDYLDSTKARVENKNPLDLDGCKTLCLETGLDTPTGGRIYKVRDEFRADFFLCTYGDGLSDVNISELVNFHKSHGKIATVTAVQPPNRFGALTITEEGAVSDFSEKPKSQDWVSGGFFVFSPKIFDYLDENSTLEREPLQRLSSDGELFSYKHHGYWQPMDTYRESLELNKIWDSGDAPWKNWDL
jgi:glucose-1-phosphate cytidylyltransferase